MKVSSQVVFANLFLALIMILPTTVVAGASEEPTPVGLRGSGGQRDLQTVGTPETDTIGGGTDIDAVGPVGTPDTDTLTVPTKAPTPPPTPPPTIPCNGPQVGDKFTMKYGNKWIRMRKGSNNYRVEAVNHKESGNEGYVFEVKPSNNGGNTVHDKVLFVPTRNRYWEEYEEAKVKGGQRGEYKIRFYPTDNTCRKFRLVLNGKTLYVANSNSRVNWARIDSLPAGETEAEFSLSPFGSSDWSA